MFILGRVVREGKKHKKEEDFGRYLDTLNKSGL